MSNSTRQHAFSVGVLSGVHVSGARRKLWRRSSESDERLPQRYASPQPLPIGESQLATRLRPGYEVGEPDRVAVPTGAASLANRRYRVERTPLVDPFRPSS